MTHNHSLLLKSSAIGGILGIVGMYLLMRRRHNIDFDVVEEGDDISAALREEQEQMRIKRESKRQMPVLTNWEREL